MENILDVSSVNDEKYFFTDIVENDKYCKYRMGYYFNGKKDPENLFLKFQAKFLNVIDNKIKVVLDDDNTVNYFKRLEKKSLEQLKSTNILAKKNCKKYTAFLKKKTDESGTLFVLTLDFDDKTKLFTNNHTILLLSELEEGEEIKIIIELDSLVINTSDVNNIHCMTLLKLKRLMSLKYVPVFTEKEIPEFPFSDEDHSLENDDSETSSSENDSIDLDQRGPDSDDE